MVKRLNATFTLDDCLFGAVKLTENAYSDNYGCSNYSTGFDAHSRLPLPNCELVKMLLLLCKQ